MRLLRWIMLLAVLLGLWYVAIAVPIGGSTLRERVGTWIEKLFETTHHSGWRSPQTEQTPQDTDQLTNKDRKSLNHLIENKLETTPGKPKATATTKR